MAKGVYKRKTGADANNWRGGKVLVVCFCGKTARMLYPSDAKALKGYCKLCKGESTKGEKHPRWNGGLWRLRNKYCMKKAPTHPNANLNGYVYLHRLVAEEKIGRLLKKGEVVHHIDRDRNNNHPSNLMVFPSQSAHRLYHIKTDNL